MYNNCYCEHSRYVHMIGGMSPRKKPPASRRLTFEEGEHPCAEDRGRRASWESGKSSVSPSLGGAPCSYSGMTYLNVPDTPPRRPSTADVMIEKLQVERHEGGGLSISGVALSAHCHLTLIICGTFCLLAGIVLTYVAYGSANYAHLPTTSKLLANEDLGMPVGASTLPMASQNTNNKNVDEDNLGGNNDKDATADTNKDTATPRDSSSSPLSTGRNGSPKSPTSQSPHNLTVVGPVCIATGLVMIIVGMSLFILGRKVHKNEKENRRLVSEAQLDQLQRSFSVPAASSLRTSIPPLDQSYPILSLRRGSYWMEPTAEDPTVPTCPPYPPSPHSPTPSTPHSRPSTAVTIARVTSSRPGSRTPNTPVPWSLPERLDVASFPVTDDLEPPSKVRRVGSDDQQQEEQQQQQEDLVWQVDLQLRQNNIVKLASPRALPHNEVNVGSSHIEGYDAYDGGRNEAYISNHNNGHVSNYNDDHNDGHVSNHNGVYYIDNNARQAVIADTAAFVEDVNSSAPISSSQDDSIRIDISSSTYNGRNDGGSYVSPYNSRRKDACHSSPSCRSDATIDSSYTGQDASHSSPYNRRGSLQEQMAPSCFQPVMRRSSSIRAKTPLLHATQLGHNLPYLVPTIQVTPSGCPSPPPHLPTLPRLSRHNSRPHSHTSPHTRPPTARSMGQ